MRKVFILAIMAMLAIPAIAQTAVTGSVLDSSSIPYSGGTIQTVLVNVSGGVSPVITATNAPVIVPPVATLTSTGTFSFTLVPNASITPAGTQYSFVVCSKGTPSNLPDPMLNAVACFTTAPMTIAGSSQALTLNSATLILNPNTGWLSVGIPSLMQPSISWAIGNGGTGIQQLPVQSLLTQGVGIPPYSTQDVGTITIPGLTANSACEASIPAPIPASWRTGVRPWVAVNTNTATVELTNPGPTLVSPIGTQVNVKCIL